jgi:Cdc6-like AAA superfamily ATPase
MKSTDSREDTLRRLRFEGTCEWATRLDVVSRWLDPEVAVALPKALHGGRCLWIYGKPGSGKSVLSAFLYDQITAIVAKQHKDAIRNAPCPGFEGSEDCTPILQAKLWTALYFPFHGNATLMQAAVTLVHRILLQHPANEALHDVASKFQDKPRTETVAMELLTGLIHGLSLT